MADQDSPRSSRTGRKKSNTLARLAARKRTGIGSEDGSDFGSRGSLGSATPRSSRAKPPLNTSYNNSSDEQKSSHEDGHDVNGYSSNRQNLRSGYHDSPPRRSARAIGGSEMPPHLVAQINGNDSESDSNDSGLRELNISDETEKDYTELRKQYDSHLTIDDTSDRSKSEVDLRKRDRLLDNLRDNRIEKRTASLSQADVEETLSRLEEEDGLADLRRVHPPRPSAMSPTPTSRQNNINNVNSYKSYERPWSARNDYGGADMMSERSATSTSALMQITTQRARDRSFLVGSAHHGGALLGAKELERYFPDRKMRVFIGTWNMEEIKKFPANLDDLVHPHSVDYVCDMYVFACQEGSSNRKEWEVRLQESLGPQHVLFHSAAYGVLYVSVFINRDLTWYCSTSEDAFVSVRAGSQLKTKGGVGVCFNIFGTSLLFLNSHLTAHEGNIKVRLKDARTVVSNMNLPARGKSSSSSYNTDPDVTSRFDCVFWCGDMNFRIDKEEDRIKRKIVSLEQAKNYEDLLEYDELSKVMAHGEAFNKFSEGRIKFRPTYKYTPGTDVFEAEKKRVPSYTDRVLFRCKRKGNIVCLLYDSVQDILSSDHKPVFGVYEVTLRPGRDNVSLAAGQFNREVWKTAMTRRALRLDVLQPKKTEKQSSICTIQ